jgi:metal-responsive CopG/Arc/MetJ family transcriptional regulator
LRFTVDDGLVTELDRVCGKAAMSRAALLERALREHLHRLASERDGEACARQPLTVDEHAPASCQVWPDDAGW